MNKYTICFTTIQHGKRHTHCEEFMSDKQIIAEQMVKAKYHGCGVEIMSIELVI